MITETTIKSKRLIGLPEVVAKVNLGKTAIYRYISDGKFPKPIKQGRNSSWIEAEVDDYIDNIIKSNRGEFEEDDEL